MNWVKLVSITRTPDGDFANLEIDGNHISFSEGMRLDDLPNGQEHYEEGVSKIMMAMGTNWTPPYHPVDGRVKWFKGPFDEIWVKFQSKNESGTVIQDLVWPADRVVCVVYDK